jgi:hypothetical protein
LFEPKPLALEYLNNMVADVLHYTRDPKATMELSRLVFEKTKGNPFFTISFLTKLYQAELIVRLLPSPANNSNPESRLTIVHCFACSGSITTKGAGSGTLPRSKRRTTPITWSSSWLRTCASFRKR